MVIFRYFAKELYATVLTITFVLLAIFITNQLVHYLDNAASGSITITAVMQVMSLQIPLLLGYLLPLSLYLGILITYGRFYADSEMTVLSACGMSRAQLLGITMVIAVIVMGVVAVLSLWAEPIINTYRTRILLAAVTSDSIEKIVPKRFQRFFHSKVFYVDQLDRKHQTIYHVFVADQKAGTNQWDLLFAQMGQQKYIKALQGNFVVFHQGNRYVGVPGEKNFQILSFHSYGVRIAPPISHSDWPESASTPELFHLSHSERDPVQRRQVQALLQWRLAMPISVLLFALIASPLSVVKPRSGKWIQLFPAIIIYIVYADLMFLGRSWISEGVISARLGLWWVHGLALLLGFLLNLYWIGWRRCVRFFLKKRSAYEAS